MRYLLDTCALIWLGMGGGDLSADARRRITTVVTGDAKFPQYGVRTIC